MKLDPADPKKLVPDDKLTVIDLKASPPKVSAQLQAGKGAAGVSINRAGTLALVANRSEGTVSVFSIAGNTLTPVGKVALGDEKSGPSHVAIAPDGKSALVTRDGDHKISVLSIDGSKVEYTKRDISAGLRPYGLDIHPNGKVAVVANIGTGSGDADTASLIDLEAKPARVVHTVTVGQTPEGIALSPDGAFAAVSVMNGSNKPKNNAVLQRLRPGEGLERQGQRIGPADRGQGRPLVPGARLEQGQPHAAGAMHGPEGDHGVQLRRQGAQAGRVDQGQCRPRGDSHR